MSLKEKQLKKTVEKEMQKELPCEYCYSKQTFLSTRLPFSPLCALQEGAS